MKREERRRPAATHGAASSGSGAKLYGVSPVLEALRAAERPIDHITIAEGALPSRLRELIELAHDAGVPVRRAPRGELARLVGAGANHQGVVASVAAARYADANR
ncbi:MAG: RNA methyltransferase substrate-binding domain-containing protein, partial [Pyrinomonadaceae bacterium]